MLNYIELLSLFLFCKQQYENSDIKERELAFGIAESSYEIDLKDSDYYTEYGILSVKNSLVEDDGLISIYVDLAYFDAIKAKDMMEYNDSNEYVGCVDLIQLHDLYTESERKSKNLYTLNAKIEYHVVSDELAKKKNLNSFKYICSYHSGIYIGDISNYFDIDIDYGTHNFTRYNSYILSYWQIKRFSHCKIICDKLLIDYAAYKEIEKKKIDLHILNDIILGFDTFSDETTKNIINIFHWLYKHNDIKREYYNRVGFCFFDSGGASLQQLSDWFTKHLSDLRKRYTKAPFMIKILVFSEDNTWGEPIYRYDKGIVNYTKISSDIIQECNYFYKDAKTN